MNDISTRRIHLPHAGLELSAGSGWSRRSLLKSTAMGLMVMGSAGALAACGGTDEETGGGGGGKPKRGGTMRLGITGGDTSDGLDPHAWSTNPAQMRVNQLYDPLVKCDANGAPSLFLATAITPNADATQWEIEIPKGITTHSGKTLTADDVLFTFERFVENQFSSVGKLGPIDLKTSKALSDTVLRVNFKQPYGVFFDMLAYPFFFVVPRGFDPKKPDGTGPFKYESFTAGVESTFVRNENYWQDGLPYLDRIETIDIKDESSQVNALVSGQVDIINFLSAGSVAALKGAGMTVKIQKSGNWVPFTQHCQVEPLSDVRVRQAFRLIVDRQQMLDQVFGGYGSIANDLYSPYDPLFASEIPQREQDIDQAKSLLKAAGYENLQITLHAPPATAGMTALAQVFATQAKAAGVTVRIEEPTVETFFTELYKNVDFGMDYGSGYSLVSNTSALMLGDRSFYNTNHFDDPQYTRLFDECVRTADKEKQKELVGEMSRIDWETGGYIVPVYSPAIDAWSSAVGGVPDYLTGIAPGNVEFHKMWMA